MILKPPVTFKCSCMTKRHNSERFLGTFVDTYFTEWVYQRKSRPVRWLILTCVISSPAAVVKRPAKSDFRNRFFLCGPQFERTGHRREDMAATGV